MRLRGKGNGILPPTIVTRKDVAHKATSAGRLPGLPQIISGFEVVAAIVLGLLGTPLGRSAEPPRLQRFARSEPHMGVEFEVVLYADDIKLADRALTAAMARIAALDKSL